MRLRIGQRLRSQVCTAEFIVTKAPPDELELTAGGHEPVELGTEVGTVEPVNDLMTGSLLGKRYVDPGSGLEVLVTKGGQATLAVGAVPLEIKATTPLPSSD